jgi:hypothetical protein
MRFRLAVIASAATLLPHQAGAQIRASEIGTMSQLIDGTKITMQYSRPRIRGRMPMFGSRAVHWDEVWTPGANWATTFDVNKDIKLNGNTVPKGTYSVWLVVKEKGDWTMVLDPKSRRYHMYPPDSSANQIRFPVHPEEAPFTEVLTWSVPDIKSSGGTLAFQWATTRVAMAIQVEPSLKMTLSQADAAPYLGRYEYIERDSTGKAKATKTFTISYENETLKGEYDPADPYFKKFALIRVQPDWFVPGVYDRNGEIYEVYRPELTFEFTKANGRASGFELRNDDDKVEATATRKP